MARSQMIPCVLATVLGLLVGGCFGGADVQRTFYSLTYPMERVTNRAGHHYPVRLLLRRFDAGLAYSKQEIVYRANPYEFSYYNFRSWSSKPAKMLQAKVAEHLRRAKLVAGVDDRIGNQLPDFELQGEVMAIEELNTSDELWYAHLAMRLTLVRFSDREIVWTHHFDERKRAVERSPVHVVRMMSEIMEEQMTVAVAGMDAYFATVLTGTPLVPAKPVSTTPSPPPETRIEPVRPKARLIK